MRSIVGKYGEIWYYGKDKFIGRSIHNYGEFSPDECDMISSLAIKNKKCLDIGANFGCISQRLEYDGFEVIAFEPQKELFDNILRKNFRGIAHNCALSFENGTTIMPRLRYGDNNSYGQAACNTRSDLGYVKVPMFTLDSFEIDNIGLIKIDVEGFELNVLKGGVATIERNRPVMYIEDDIPNNRKALRAYIVSLGYSIEEHQPTLYRENNFFGLKKNIFDRNYVSHNIICRPC
jgi:FkbM family methyltransferase